MEPHSKVNCSKPLFQQCDADNGGQYQEWLPVGLCHLWMRALSQTPAGWGNSTLQLRGSLQLRSCCGEVIVFYLSAALSTSFSNLQSQAHNPSRNWDTDGASRVYDITQRLGVQLLLYTAMYCRWKTLLNSHSQISHWEKVLDYVTFKMIYLCNLPLFWQN